MSEWTAEQLGDWLDKLSINTVVQADWDDLDHPKRFIPREPGHWRDVDGPKKFILQENGLWRDLDGHEWNAYGLAAQAVEMEWDCRWSVVAVPIDALLSDDAVLEIVGDLMLEDGDPWNVLQGAIAHVTGEAS